MITTEEELIFTALGEASMCWSETPSGVFDSTRAQQIGEKLYADLFGMKLIRPSADPIILESNKNLTSK